MNSILRPSQSTSSTSTVGACFPRDIEPTALEEINEKVSAVFNAQTLTCEKPLAKEACNWLKDRVHLLAGEKKEITKLDPKLLQLVNSIRKARWQPEIQAGDRLFINPVIGRALLAGNLDQSKVSRRDYEYRLRPNQMRNEETVRTAAISIANGLIIQSARPGLQKHLQEPIFKESAHPEEVDSEEYDRGEEFFSCIGDPPESLLGEETSESPTAAVDALKVVPELIVDSNKEPLTQFFSKIPAIKKNTALFEFLTNSSALPKGCIITCSGNELEIKNVGQVEIKVDLDKQIEPQLFTKLNRQTENEHLQYLQDKPINKNSERPSSYTLGNLAYFGSLGPNLWKMLKAKGSKNESSQLLDPNNSIKLVIDPQNENRIRFEGLPAGLSKAIDTVDFGNIHSLGRQYGTLLLNQSAWLGKENYILDDLFKLIELTKV
jgi:hypothetical protein